MPYNRQYSDPLQYDTEGGGPGSRLITRLIGIQERKNEQARRDEMLRIAEEERQRNNKIEDENRLLQATQLAQALHALQDRPKEKKDTVVATTSLKAPEVVAPMSPDEQAAMDATGEAAPPPDLGIPVQPQGVPDILPLTIPTMERTPTPVRNVSIAGQDLAVPMFDKSETMARQAESTRAAKLAAGGAELTPEMIAKMPAQLRDVFQMFAGSIQEPPNLSSAMAALVRGDTTRPPTHKEWVINGKRTAATDAQVEEALARGDTVTEYDKPPSSSTTILPFAANMDGKLTLIDRRTGKPIEGLAPADTADMRNKVAGRELAAASINAVRQLSAKIITKVGPSQRADAIKRGAEAVFGSDPEFRTYQDARMALAGNLAVAQQGSRPSDADIKAIWLPLVPDAYRDTGGPDGSAEMKWNLINTMMATNRDTAQPTSPDATGTGTNALTPPPGLSPAALAVWKKAMGVTP